MWKTIQNEECYEVSDKGEIRNKETKHIKSLRGSSKGYLRVTLYPSGKTYSVHRLVAQAYCEKVKEDLNVVNHKDGNKQNNRSSNLEWCTPKQNVHHAIDAGLMQLSDWSSMKNPQKKLDRGLVWSLKFGILKEVSSTKLSKMLLVSEETIRRIRVGQAWSEITE